MRLLPHLAWFLLVSAPASSSEGQEELKVKPGEDVTLQCKCPRASDITLLEWIRPELKEDGYVFFYRNNRSYENYQHEDFVGRVKLRNKSLVSEGDVSVVLSNVSVRDTGTYECRVVMRNAGDVDRSTTELKRLISLKVSGSGDTAGNKNPTGRAVEVGVGVSVALLVVVIVVIFFIRLRISRKVKKDQECSDCHQDRA